MGTLLNPTDRTRGGIRWGLVAHTATMLSFVTISASASFDLYSIGLVDNREFPGNSIYTSGPFGYQDFVNAEVICVLPNVMVILNNCLADGFLVGHCIPFMCLTQAIPVDLSLLRDLLHELLGHRLALPHVPGFSGCVLGFTAS